MGDIMQLMQPEIGAAEIRSPEVVSLQMQCTVLYLIYTSGQELASRVRLRNEGGKAVILDIGNELVCHLQNPTDTHHRCNAL